jgi:site-specific DNA recombinase
VAEIYKDDGVSGTVPLNERPEGRRLLEDAKEGKFGAVLVYKLDRLGRSLLVIVDAHDRLQEAGVALRSATEPIDTSTPSGRLILQMLASFAEYERGTIRERTQAGLHRAYRNGRQTGVVPYGFTIAEDGSFVIVEGEARIVAQIFEKIAAGATLYSEAKRLNDLAVPPPGFRYRSGKRTPSKQWGPPTIRNLIHQRAYSGTHEVKINGGKDLISREVPAIVTPKLQERAVKALAENKRYSGGKKHRDYLLTGLVTCETFGCACTGRTHIARGKQYPYYKCSDDHVLRSHRGPTHQAPYVNATWLEGLVWDDVKRFLENPGEVLERIREQLTAADDTEELEARRAELTRRLATKSAEKDRYVRALAQGHISEEELAVYAADLKNQVENLKLLIASVESDLAAQEEHQMTAESTEAWLMTLGSA